MTGIEAIEYATGILIFSVAIRIFILNFTDNS